MSMGPKEEWAMWVAHGPLGLTFRDASFVGGMSPPPPLRIFFLRVSLLRPLFLIYTDKQTDRPASSPSPTWPRIDSLPMMSVSLTLSETAVASDLTKNSTVSSHTCSHDNDESWWLELKGNCLWCHRTATLVSTELGRDLGQLDGNPGWRAASGTVGSMAAKPSGRWDGNLRWQIIFGQSHVFPIST